MSDQPRRLPLFAALAAFILYVCTMGSGVTSNSMPLMAKLAGWDPMPLVGQPLLWLFTLPLHLLPAAAIPLALKLFSAALAGVILWLRARTVQLLPWDHSWEGANRLALTLPVFLACALCGLEFNFWQEATSSCGELLDLLPLVAVVWLLLEYNVRRQPRWLTAAPVIWGLGMAENWLLLLLLPFFVAAVIRL